MLKHNVGKIMLLLQKWHVEFKMEELMPASNAQLDWIYWMVTAAFTDKTLPNKSFVFPLSQNPREWRNTILKDELTNNRKRKKYWNKNTLDLVLQPRSDYPVRIIFNLSLHHQHD